MLRRLAPNKIGLILLATLLASPALAHKLEITEDVGGTFHIEPNDAPRAGETELAWFALTQKGGEIIPLEQCNCKLEVYAQPRTTGASPLPQPPLRAVSAKRYQGIPGTEITFPQAGAYQLEISGTPKNEANFQPFKLNFEIIVAPGVAAPTPKTNTQTAQIPTETEPANQWLIPAIATATTLALGIAWLVWQQLKPKSY